MSFFVTRCFLSSCLLVSLLKRVISSPDTAAVNQFLVLKVEDGLVYEELEIEPLVGVDQHLTEGQALVHHSNVHISGPSSHQISLDHGGLSEANISSNIEFTEFLIV